MELQDFFPIQHIADAQIPFIILIDYDNYNVLQEDCHQNLNSEEIIEHIEAALKALVARQHEKDWKSPFGFRIFQSSWNNTNYEHYVGDIKCYTTTYNNLISNEQYHLYYYQPFASIWTVTDFNNFLNEKGE